MKFLRSVTYVAAVVASVEHFVASVVLVKKTCKVSTRVWPYVALLLCRISLWWDGCGE